MDAYPYTLYGHPYWLDCQRVLAIMQQGGISQDRVGYMPTITGNLWEDLLPGGASDEEPFNNKRPQLEDHTRKFSMFKGRAIARYLLKQEKANQLLPAADDPVAFARFEQACAVEVGDFDPIANELIDEAENKANDFEHNAKRYESLKKSFAQVLQGYERMLSKTKYLAGDKLTAADVFHYPCVRALNKHPDAIAPLKDSSNKNVKRWWDEISALKVDLPELIG